MYQRQHGAFKVPVLQKIERQFNQAVIKPINNIKKRDLTGRTLHCVGFKNFHGNRSFRVKCSKIKHYKTWVPITDFKVG